VFQDSCVDVVAEGVADPVPHQMSGAMLPRVLIALAPAGEPRLLVGDEQPAFLLRPEGGLATGKQRLACGGASP
jgi:ABC-type transporter Mla maintaining outer membrane lipid asymmetry ATPase subunit MlaF